MFGLRCFTEAQPRWKNGHPAQSTIGVASANSIHVPTRGESTCMSGPMRSIIRNIIGNMASAMSGTPRMTLHQKRRVMSRSSGFSSSAAVTVRGSKRHAADGAEARLRRARSRDAWGRSTRCALRRRAFQARAPCRTWDRARASTRAPRDTWGRRTSQPSVRARVPMGMLAAAAGGRCLASRRRW